MLNSNQACDTVFDTNLLKKLNTSRLKKFKQSCERFRTSFFASCCEMGCERSHVQTDFEGYKGFGGYRTLAQYKNWSKNMHNIRELLKVTSS